MNRRLLAVHSLAQTRQHRFYDVDGMRDRDRHQDEYGGSALAEQRHAGPAHEAGRSDDDTNDHQDDRNGSPDGAQHQHGNQQHDPERNGPEEFELLVHCVAHGTIQGELAGNVVVDGRILRPRLGCGAVEGVDDLHLGRLSDVPALGKRDADHQPGHAAIPGNEAPVNLFRRVRDRLDACDIVVAERGGVVDERLDDQLVLESLAVRIVRDGIDAGDVGRQPELFGQLLDGNERFLREDGAALRRHRNKRGVGDRVGLFQVVERDNARIILLEVITNIDVDRYQVLGARSEGQHDKQREQNRQPSAPHDVGDAGL